jgi:threonine efflux protein
MLEEPPVALAVIAAILIYAVAVPLPGPSFVAITRTTMVSGRTAGAFAALGVTLAAAIYALATLMGISALLATLPWLVTAVQIGGGAYLVFLGVALLRAHFRGQAPLMEPLPQRRSRLGHAESRQAFIKGFAATIGNPKMAAFFLGLFAPIAGPAPPDRSTHNGSGWDRAR